MIVGPKNFNKAARDLITRLQKIDGDNYPEKCEPENPDEKTISEDEIVYSKGNDSFKVGLAPDVPSSPAFTRERIEHPQLSPIHEKASFKFEEYRLPVEKSMDMQCLKSKAVENYAMSKAAENYALYDASKVAGGIGSPLVTGVMAFVTGIVAMIKVTRNMPRKLTDSNMYSTSVYCDDTMIKSQIKPPEPVISAEEHMAVLKRLAELEEKVNALSMKPAVMPPEKEEMLNSAISRVDALEQELMATKKALEDSLSRQEELVAYLDKKKKKKKLFAW